MGRNLTVPKRDRRRSRLYLPAAIHSDCGSREALVRDISSTGALLESSEAPPVGSQVRLVCGSSEVGGRVAWRASTWFGIEFSQPLKGGYLLRQVRPALRVSAPRTYRREIIQDNRANSDEA